MYVDFNWKAKDWEYPLKNGCIDIYVIGEASYSSKARWAEMEGHVLPKELLYEASITIDSIGKLIMLVENEHLQKALESL